MTTIIALHGFTGCGADFDLLGHHLGRPLVTPDLPGHRGAPEIGGVRMSDAVRAVAEAVAAPAVRGGPVDLIGYSMGGRVALAFALADPGSLRRLVLIGAGPGIADEAERRTRRRRDEALGRQLVGEGLSGFLEMWGELPLMATQRRMPEPWRSAQLARKARHDASGLAAALRGYGAGATEPLWAGLSGLTQPVLLVTGAEDDAYGATAAAMLERLPVGRHVVIAGAGHAPHLEASGPTAEVIRGFLA